MAHWNKRTVVREIKMADSELIRSVAEAAFGDLVVRVEAPHEVPPHR